MIGLIGGLALLIILTMKGVNILIAGPISALFVALMSGMPLFSQLAAEGEANFVTSYMTGLYWVYHVLVFDVPTRCSIR